MKNLKNKNLILLSKSIKRSIGLLIAFVMLITVIGFTLTDKAYAAGEDINIYINGKILNIPTGYGQAFFDTNGRTQIPLRALLEALGYEVVWTGKDGIIEIPVSKEANAAKITIQLNNRVVTTPNGTITMDTVAFIKDSRTYVPLRFVSEALGYKVGYSQKHNNNSTGAKTTHIITVDKDGSTTPVVNENPGTITGGSVTTYESKNGAISMNQIGSMKNSPIGTRPSDNSFKADVQTLRQILKGTSYTVSDFGYLQTETAHTERSDPMSGFIIKRTDLELNNDGFLTFDGTKYVAIDISDWALTKNEESFADTKILMNFALESFKFFSQSIRDGEMLFSFLDNKIKTKTAFDLTQTYSFGKTKVKFYETPFAGFGVYVVFM